MFILQVSSNKGFRRNIGSLFRCFYCSVLLKKKKMLPQRWTGTSHGDIKSVSVTDRVLVRNMFLHFFPFHMTYP